LQNEATMKSILARIITYLFLVFPLLIMMMGVLLTASILPKLHQYRNHNTQHQQQHQHQRQHHHPTG
jgi:hypothetical protein